MKNFTYYVFMIVLLSSCARMPYDQWNSRLVNFESEIANQVLESDETCSPDVFLFNGVYNATRKKEELPYPVLKKNSESLEAYKNRIKTKSDFQLKSLTSFRTKYAEKSISTVGPQWTDYQKLIADLQGVSELNKLDILQIDILDHEFDSICIAHKIKAVPMLDFEVKLAQEMNVIESQFDGLKISYEENKKTITNRPDAQESMMAMNRMKQKIRQIENELHQFSNLFSRISSLRADAMIFVGPFIDSMAEIKLIDQKTKKLKGLLSELNRMVETY